MTRKSISNVYYIQCQHRFINIVQQLGQNNFENYSFTITKFDRYFVKPLMESLMSSKCFIRRGSQVMMNFVLSKFIISIIFLIGLIVSGLPIRKSQISDCCFWVYLPLE